MPEISIALNPDSFKLLSDYSQFGFNNQDEFVDSALNTFVKNLNEPDLVSSAKLYLNEYRTDPELRELTESAVNDFKE